MTNSTPKNNRIERQGSPNGKKWTPQSRKSVTYFASSASKEMVASLQQQQTSSSSSSPAVQTTKRQQQQTPAKSCSPSNNRSSQQQPIPRFSPMRHDSPRGSPTNNFYAGAKFSEPPSPAMLPKPPSHWTGLRMRALATTCGQENARCQALMLPCNITQHFSKIINVSA